MDARLRGLVAVIALAGLAACTGRDAEPTTGPAASLGEASPVTHAQILEERTVGDLGASRVGEGVIPPTNRWYSSLAFGEGGLPVYPRPLSFRPQEGGFAFGLTTPVASADSIIAAARDDVHVSIEGAAGLGTVTAADSVAVALSTGPAAVTLAQGWPAISLVATEALDATMSATFRHTSDAVWVAAVDGREYGIVVRDGSVDGATLHLERGGSAALFAVPQGGDALAFGTALGAQPPQPEVTSRLTGETAVTTVVYRDTPTVVVLPQARAAQSGLPCSLGTFSTIDGHYAACEAKEASHTVPLLTPSSMLDLDGISDAHRDAIEAALEADVAATPTTLPGDSYFGSKALYRIANLVQIADALGRTDLADPLAARLADELLRWADPTGCEQRDSMCFVYDPAAQGVVGLTPSFGSENFNDHHFHYGYLLYAAAVAGERDPALVDQIGPVFDLVADDIAAPVASDSFPQWRTFDPVAGHSWASGTSPFADGNNQESSSEALAAWNAVALWREVRHEAHATQTAQWMLSVEADAARRLYLAPDLAAFSEYTHSTVGIEWSSKRDFATWFSPEPNAVVGIQLIPSPPVAATVYRAIDAERVLSAVEDAAAPGSGAQFSDYLLMFQASASPADASTAWDAAVVLPEEVIDNANSRTYMLAWIASHA